MGDEDTRQPTTADDLVAHLEAGDHAAAVDCLARIEADEPKTRKDALRRLDSLAQDQPSQVSSVLPALAPFLTDEDRAVRLTTAKLFVSVAESVPGDVLPLVSDLGDRLSDEDEFYYVRARAAEALGYVAVEFPDEVASPELLADLRVGLAFEEETEVREKLAKSLEHVALGDPARLRHLVSRLVEHLDDESDLVRYHLTTGLVVVGCASPAALADVQDALADRLDDENPQVRGRAAEALGLLARSDAVESALPDGVPGLTDDEDGFVADRARFATGDLENSNDAGGNASPGTLESVRETTADAVEAVRTPADADECPGCGLTLPDDDVPFCPRCGAPH
ncbi:HEAT repeat domain-containing protein [Haloarchaeobius amylolyticus]|uniref:HEAT repeat domain-containing protein n=1 Tax=Haloarchaeobius amylolyticus TaxID=1198296 RepID=UPI00226E03AD|nr:HEAT repeat domain-containing protein [Haloarchaeobius amylolyticus]